MKLGKVLLIGAGVAGVGAAIYFLIKSVSATPQLIFEACKNVGDGDPTATIEISTDKGVIGTVESGPMEYAFPCRPWTEFPGRRITIGIPTGAEWVRLRNLDGATVLIKKYPVFKGQSLTAPSPLSDIYSECSEYWVCNDLIFRLI
jgi:hypothetical protein